jgi:hypothetical protein
MSTATRYRVPRVCEEVEVSLDSFDIDDIRDYLKHHDGSAKTVGNPSTYASHGSLTLEAGDLGRIDTLALCGQQEAAREYLVEIVSRHLGRRL